MKTIPIENMPKIRKAIPKIENKIKIRISFDKGKVMIKGSELNEFVVEKVVRAVDFGFDVEDALLLKSEDFVLEFIDIKEHTHRKNLREVRGRVIGTDGRARKTIEELTGGIIVVHDNMVGLIVDSEHLEPAVQGIVSLIHGAKHSNIFSYLERQNSGLKKIDREDLGLKDLGESLI